MARVIPFLAIVCSCIHAAPAAAQLLSKWGHPVFTIGGTPYDSINQGHGEYPGGPGFIPGYGYYPGAGPDHYPWLDGPGVPFDRRQPTAGPVEVLTPHLDRRVIGQALSDGGTIIVKVPAEAELSFDGSLTSQGGSYRRFVTPPLPAGRTAVYSIHVHWIIKDVELERTEEVSIAPGQTVIVNLLTAEGWTGRRLESLPEPRPLSNQ